MGRMGESPNHLQIKVHLSSNPTLKLTGQKTLAGAFKNTNFSRRKPFIQWLIYLSPPPRGGEPSPPLPEGSGLAGFTLLTPASLGPNPSQG